MANKPINLVGYGLTNALQNIFPAPVVAQRAPTTADTGYQIGQVWIDKPNNDPYILTSIVSNSANWLLLQDGGGSGVFSSLTVTPGPISLTGTTSINTSGAAVTTIGTGGTGAVNIGNATGNTAVTGSLSTTTSLSATTTITAGTGITSTTGNIVATAGAVNAGTTMTAGTGITATTGDIVATAGALSAGTTVTAGTGITATTGNIVATTGNITATDVGSKVTGGTIYASGDAGGVVATTSLTNVANSAVSTGIMTINSTTANPGANAGYLKMYLGSTSIFVPYFTDIAP